MSLCITIIIFLPVIIWAEMQQMNNKQDDADDNFYGIMTYLDEERKNPWD
jgi:hypothetical protein